MTIDAKAVDEIIDNIIEHTLVSPIEPNLLKETCDRLVDAGLSILRVNMSWTTLHPTIGALTLKWWRDQDFDDLIRYAHSDGESADWLNSPGYYAVSNRVNHLDIPMERDYSNYNFPLLDELKEVGGTHYILNLYSFSRDDYFMHDEDGMFLSWLSDRPGGFTEEELHILNRVEKHTAIALKMALRERISLNTLTAYLGENAANRVLKGSIKLGDGEVIPAVIWYSDLRKSTNLGDTLPGPELLSTLNDYFSCTAGAVMDHGGEVLRFVGDAVLAIFPSKDLGMKQACEKATLAAKDALSRMDDVNQVRQEAGKEKLAFGLGLHTGDLMFGNIGVPERLDFSVTGPAANEVARIEDMTKEVGAPVLASSDFAQHAPKDWVHKGTYPMRGVERSLELFILR